VKYKDILAIEKKLTELREPFEMTPRGPMSKAIEYLEQLLTTTRSLEGKAVLYSLVVDEALHLGNRELAIHYLREQAQHFPDEPWALTRLAMTLVHDLGARDEALSVATTAVDVARRANKQVKYSLMYQARVALEAVDYPTFHLALRRLIDDARNQRGFEDQALEFDFLDRIDPTLADMKLVSQYRALAAQQRDPSVAALSNDLEIRYDAIRRKLGIYHPDKTRFVGPIVELSGASLRAMDVEAAAIRLGRILLLLIPEFRVAFPWGSDNSKPELVNDLIDVTESSADESYKAYQLALHYMLRARLNRSADDLEHVETYLERAALLGNEQAKRILNEYWTEAKKAAFDDIK
jgi:hypothetical protein